MAAEVVAEALGTLQAMALNLVAAEALAALEQELAAQDDIPYFHAEAFVLIMVVLEVLQLLLAAAAVVVAEDLHQVMEASKEAMLVMALAVE